MEVSKDLTALPADQAKQASDLTNIATWMDLYEDSSDDIAPQTTLTMAEALIDNAQKENANNTVK